MGMISEMRAVMAKLAWPVLVALSFSIPIVPLSAEAGRHGGGDSGGGGGGGRLGQVSSGLGRATGGSSPSPSPSPGPTTFREHRHYDDRYDGVYAGAPVVIEGGVAGDALPEGAAQPSPPRRVFVDFYAGAQKVYESDGSLTADLAFNEGRFRLGGSITRYYERQEGLDPLTFTVGSLYLGYRIDDGGPTKAYLEAGGVGARTRNDPVMDSSVAGLLGGVRVEHTVARRLAVIGDAQVMSFEDDVRGGAVRAGVRVGHLQATVRYFDLNVGPALFGPEVGLAF
jgi:hypothetical protein